MDRPVAFSEDSKTIEEDDDSEVNEGEPGSVWLEAALEEEFVAVHVLSDEGLSELNVGNQDGEPGEEIGNSGEVLEPAKDVVGTARHTKVCEAGNGGSNDDGIVWDTSLGAGKEDLGGLLVLGESEQVTRARVEEGVSRGRGRGQNDGVDDGWEDRDTSAVNGNDPRGVSCTDTAMEKVTGVRGNANTNCQRAEDVEEENTPEDTTNGLGDVLPGVLSLASCNGNHLNSTVGERSVDKGREKTQESTGRTCSNVLLHGAGVLPVTKSETIVARRTAEINDESDKKQANNSNDLDTGENELGFTIDGDCKDVQADDEHDDDRDPGSLIDLVVPETNNDGSS